MRPFHTFIPTKLLAGKIPAVDQRTPEDLKAEDSHAPLLQELCGIRCCQSVWAEEPHKFCSSQLCRKPAPQTRSILLPELLLFSSEVINPCEAPECLSSIYLYSHDPEMNCSTAHFA